MALFSEAGQQEVEIVAGGLNLFGKDGSRYAIPVPAALAGVYLLPNGLLLKCKSQQSFHHSQVMGLVGGQEAQFTYLTLTQHPYNDLYPLGALNGSLFTSVSVDILHSSQRFPLLFGKDSGTDLYTVYLLRVNLSALVKDNEDLSSLDPSQREDLYNKHVSSFPCLIAERLFRFEAKLGEFQDLIICTPSDTRRKE
jgi:hypothetical protein